MFIVSVPGVGVSADAKSVQSQRARRRPTKAEPQRLDLQGSFCRLLSAHRGVEIKFQIPALDFKFPLSGFVSRWLSQNCRVRGKSRHPKRSGTGVPPVRSWCL